MSFLDNLTADQKDLLISLPYRVGLYVSQSDTSGGDSSDEEEAQALSALLNGYAQEIFGAETVQYIISETVRREDLWPEWGGKLDTIEEDCRDAIDILHDHVDEKEVSAFKNHLMEIGESVALAFREYGEDTPLLDRIKIFLIYFSGKMQAMRSNLPYKSYNEFLNISLDERSALLKLAGALNVRYL